MTLRGPVEQLRTQGRRLPLGGRGTDPLQGAVDHDDPVCGVEVVDDPARRPVELGQPRKDPFGRGSVVEPFVGVGGGRGQRQTDPAAVDVLDEADVRPLEDDRRQLEPPDHEREQVDPGDDPPGP